MSLSALLLLLLSTVSSTASCSLAAGVARLGAGIMDRYQVVINIRGEHLSLSTSEVNICRYQHPR